MKLQICWVLLLCGLIATGCSSLGVKPWERNILAQEDMLMDADALDLAFDEHIYFSKEASSGGQGFSGGGCGCN
ncbi:MAG: DUF4266 domain-containing protein [Gammaproteobacteria bacterium]|nr:DUF4266 domain-containing protein [Gammaproteobacteria bacterium]MCP4981792.1 DUF4266 domain-containing protein [Gammaproteobacteria bacterium]